MRLLAWSLATAIALPMLGASPRAGAAPVVPAGGDFQIWYYKTDEDSDRKSYFSSQDLGGYMNRARCECAQEISTRILLKPAQGGTYDNTKPIQTFVGTRCNEAVGTFNPQINPCVRVFNGFANAYTKAINFNFNPIWLAGGVNRNLGGMDQNNAVATGTCGDGQGTAGIWICIEDGMTTECQANEFQVTGTQNNNATGSMGMTSQGITFDFRAPQNLPSDFDIDTGDGTVLITWKLLTTGDVAGYRVLCADADGNPLPGRGLDPPPLAQVNVGKLYFTKDNLCPEGPFGEVIEVDDSGGNESGGTGGSTTDGTGGDGTGDSTTTGSGLDDDQIVDGIAHASTGTSSGGDSGPPMRDTDASGTGSADTGDVPATGIMSMDWAYVCSDHIGGTSQKAKVTGLENDREYQFAIVAYDLAGNPIVASGDLPLVASPRETTDLWEQCEQDGNVCGDGGFCNCSLEDDGADGAVWLGVLAGFGALRRRRRGRG